MHGRVGPILHWRDAVNGDSYDQAGLHGADDAEGRSAPSGRQSSGLDHVLTQGLRPGPPVGPFLHAGHALQRSGKRSWLEGRPGQPSAGRRGRKAALYDASRAPARHLRPRLDSIGIPLDRGQFLWRKVWERSADRVEPRTLCLGSSTAGWVPGLGWRCGTGRKDDRRLVFSRWRISKGSARQRLCIQSGGTSPMRFDTATKTRRLGSRRGQTTFRTFPIFRRRRRGRGVTVQIHRRDGDSQVLTTKLLFAVLP